MSTLSKFFDAPRVVDSLRILGKGILRKNQKARYTINGSPPTVEDVMARFGVDKKYAEEFLRRNA